MKPIEFTIPCSKLCEFEHVKNFTRLDGSTKTFIEKSAADKLADALERVRRFGKISDLQGRDIIGEALKEYRGEK